MPIENAEVARLFRELADLLEIEGANAFRVRAYRNAARTVQELPESVDEMVREHPERLTDLPGIGEDLAGKIAEILRTGRLKTLVEVGRRLPRGLGELMRLPGLGPKRAKLLYDALGVRSLKQLEQALQRGRVEKVRGFGPKTRARLLKALATNRPGERRLPRPTAAQYGDPLLEHLRQVPGVRRTEIAGSYRRRKDTVGDLDVLVTARQGTPVVNRFITYPEVGEVLARGPTRASVRLRSGLQVDLRVLPEESYGAGLFYFTGSKAHNIAVRKLAQQRGLKINEYGVWKGGTRIAGRTETEVLGAVGLPLIPPELREDRGEIEAAVAGRLPRLLDLTDIRGDLQSHTTDSDGRDTLNAMAEAAETLGYEYLAVTDHSPAVRVAGGLDRAGFRRQMKRIDRLNGKLKKLTVLKGAEVDILADGSLDLDDATLAALDVVVVSIHSRFELPGPQQTRRVLAAIRHPSVDILGHPTGRQIGRRPGIEMDLEEVTRAAVEHGVLLEVNAQPERLDLDDIAVRSALGHGAKLVVSTDAHAIPELNFMRWGVDQARRGWARREDVANTRPLSGLLQLLHRERGS